MKARFKRNNTKRDVAYYYCQLFKLTTNIKNALVKSINAYAWKGGQVVHVCLQAVEL